MKIKKILNALVTTLLVMLFLIMLLAVLISKASGGEPSFFGYQLKSVLSGSMEPSIMTGSIIAIKPGGDLTRFEVGDVITYKESQDRLVTHRITEVVKNDSMVFYRTKGDNNDAGDLLPVQAQNVVGIYTGFTVPYVGYAMNVVSSKVGGMLVLVIPGVLLLMYSIVTSWKAISQLEQRNARKAEADTV